MPWRIRRYGNKGNDIKLVVTLFTFACISGCTTGTAVMTGQECSPIDPAAVTLYAEPPSHYEVVGIVETASSVFFFLTRQPKSVRLLNLRNKLQPSVPTV